LNICVMTEVKKAT